MDLYHFDEGTGIAALDSAGVNHGALVGTIKPAWVAGHVGSNALSFSGDGVYNQNNQSAVDLLSNLAPILGSTSSLAFWINTTQVGNATNWRTAVTGAEQTNGGNDIGWGWINSTGRIGIFVGNSGALMSNSPINNGQWHHVAISRDATSGAVKLYIDGVLDASGTLGTGPKTSVFKSFGQLTIDSDNGLTRTGGNYFNGQLDDVRIYNQLIDPAEVNAIALPPLAPINLAVTPASGTELDLTWTDLAMTETGYKVERSIDGGPWVQIQLLPANATSYDDGGLAGNALRLSRGATNTAGDSGYSNIVNTFTPVPPITPSGATATLITSTQIDLQWNDNANNEVGYKIFRHPARNQFTQIADLPPNSISFSDDNNGAGLSPGISYDYHIQAYNIAGYSDFTGVTVTTLAATPTGVAASPGMQSVMVSSSVAAAPPATTSTVRPRAEVKAQRPWQAESPRSAISTPPFLRA